jgi:hypothetical protein
MLEQISKFESVQIMLLLGITIIVVFALSIRRWRQSEELASADKRLKDLIPISQRIAAHKEREKEAGHSLARDF